MVSNPLTVDVQVQYLPQQSLPEQGLYRFAYTITITNTGDSMAQVVGRRWLVRDDRGRRGLDRERDLLRLDGARALGRPGEERGLLGLRRHARRHHLGRPVGGGPTSGPATGEGHGTHLALLAGLQGLEPDDERIPEARNLAWLTSEIRQTAERADAILTDSQFSAREICELLKAPQEKVFPVWLGLPTFGPPPAPEAVARLFTA